MAGIDDGALARESPLVDPRAVTVDEEGNVSLVVGCWDIYHSEGGRGGVVKEI